MSKGDLYGPARSGLPDERIAQAFQKVDLPADLVGDLRAIGAADRDQKMAVVIQEVVGARHGERFYPHLSAVGRSFSYYPTGYSRPEDGVVQLALGLGKTIVDGGVCWSCSPGQPTAPPPFGSVGQMLKETQSRFWAVNMGRPPAYDPVAETGLLRHVRLRHPLDVRVDGRSGRGTIRWAAPSMGDR